MAKRRFLPNQKTVYDLKLLVIFFKSAVIFFKKLVMSNTSKEEMSKYVKDKLQETGFKVKFIRVDPSDWSYSSFFSLIEKYEKDGFELKTVILDYLSLIPTVGCIATGAVGSDLRDLYRRVRNFFAKRKCLFISAHQLSPDAQMINRENLTGEVFLNRIMGKGFFDGSKKLSQEMDLELYAYKFTQNNKDYLAIGKGGSDFSPRGKSNAEIMRFCQAFMLELWRHLGPDMDVPAGDIGVGGREVGYMFGMYKKLTREFTGTFTGKGLEFGGSLIRPEATGFGGLYFVKHMLDEKGIEIKGKTVAISGFGNVAWGAATKATQLGAKVVTISGPDGYIYDPEGISGEKIDYMLELRASGNDIVAPYAEKFPGATFVPGRRPWEVKVDIALPCATQNELNGEDAQNLIKNQVLQSH
jgi:hypothetical protein